ncbi:hypothetical protein H9P43_008784 [Blastocladiella emersonii ATCC 22665]|nr:hypothetical protein H9P43_008784 [Blastocladiella emersonii ATCC 22665]
MFTARFQTLPGPLPESDPQFEQELYEDMCNILKRVLIISAYPAAGSSPNFRFDPDYRGEHLRDAIEGIECDSTTTGEYSHLEQDGKESGDVEGVDGQDDAAPASKRSRTSDSSSRRLSDSEFLMGIKEVFQRVATADSKPVLTAALEWVQDAYNDNEEYQIDVATRLTEDQALRVMAVSESKRKRILEIFIQ